MKILVVGAGGREHAIIKKLKENPATPEPEPVKEKPKKEKKKGPGLFGRLTKGIDTFGKTLFDDDDNESK